MLRALHSVLALESGRPSLAEAAEVNLARVRSLRDEIARLWIEKAEDPHWSKFYEVMVDTFDARPPAQVSEAPISKPGLVMPGVKTEAAAGVKQEIKEEPVSPRNQRKRRAKSKPPVDLSTPPARGDASCNTPRTPKQKTCKRAAECMNLVTPPRVEKVGGTRNAMRKQADSKTKAAAHAKMSAAVAAVSSKPAKSKAVKKEQKHETKQKRAAKTKAKKPADKPADTNLEADPGAEEPDGSPEQPDQPRTRVKKRERTLEDHKLDVVKAYLLRLKMSWPQSQNFHTLHPVDQYAADCKKNQGWNTMKTRLTELKPPECLTCLAYLKTKNFDMDKLTELLFDCQNPDPDAAWKDLLSILNSFPEPEGKAEATTSDLPAEARRLGRTESC